MDDFILSMIAQKRLNLVAVPSGNQSGVVRIVRRQPLAEKDTVFIFQNNGVAAAEITLDGFYSRRQETFPPGQSPSRARVQNQSPARLD